MNITLFFDPVHGKKKSVPQITNAHLMETSGREKKSRIDGRS